MEPTALDTNSASENNRGRRPSEATPRTTVVPAATGPSFPHGRSGESVPPIDAAPQPEPCLEQFLSRQADSQLSVAYALHDSVAQHLAAASLYFEACQPLPEGVPDAIRSNFQSGLQLLRDSIYDIRRIVGQLLASND